MSPLTLPPEYQARAGAGNQQIQLSSLSSIGNASDAIGPDDLLQTTIVTGIETETPEPLELRVSPAGTVEVPLVGSVAVAGLTPNAAARRIVDEAVRRGVYRQPSVNVAVAEQATNRITVLGAVDTPGVHEVPRTSCDIVTAIAAAGGFNEEAGAVVEVLRHEDAGALATAEPATTSGVQQASFQAPTLAAPAGAPRTESFDLTALSETPPTAQRLADRDVIIVRPREKRVVHVTGLVQNPDQFELSDDHDLRVLDAVAMAGGTTSVVADKIIVIRNVASAPQPLVIEIGINRAKRDGRENLLLQAGDMVSVEPTIATNVADAFNTLFRVTMGVGGDLTLF